MRFATKTIHAHQPADPSTGAVVAPIFQTTTFEQSSPGEHRGYCYTRTNNPTRERLESVLAEIEGVEHCAVFSSGMCAINTVLQGLLKPGDEIILPPDVYGGTHRILYRVYAPQGYQVRTVDLSRPESLRQALTSKTKIVWVESPTNPRLWIYDIARIAALAHERGALVVVDNTFATALFQHPFELGADVAVYSVNKYISGHADVTQGAALARDPAVFEPIKFLQNASGGTPSPFDCWLTLRGMKTMELRLQRQAQNARAVAEALRDHPAVRRIYYPGFAEHPGHEVARRQMSEFGGMVSFELNGSVEAIKRFVSTRKYFSLGEDVGCVYSLICHPVFMTHASIPPEARKSLGLTDELVRLSPGCENAEDLLEDLLEGLAELEQSVERPVAAVGR
jgi:cystathionine gamma-lyase